MAYARHLQAAGGRHFGGGEREEGGGEGEEGEEEEAAEEAPLPQLTRDEAPPGFVGNGEARRRLSSLKDASAILSFSERHPEACRSVAGSGGQGPASPRLHLGRTSADPRL